MNKYFYIHISFLLLLFILQAQAELFFSDKMYVTNSGGLRLQGIEKSGPLSGLQFSNAASVSADGDLIRDVSYYNQGSWLDNPSNLTGGLVFRRNGTAHVHVSTGGAVRVREIIGYDVVIDIDVDTDRDNDVDGSDELMEDTWSKGAGSRGAIVLPNCDDDGANGYPDNWIGGDWDFLIGDEPPNTVVDNAADINDLAPLHIAKMGLATLPDDLMITLRVSQVAGESSYFTPTPAEDRLRIFLPSNVSGNDHEIQAGDPSIIGPENGAQAKFVKTPANPDEFSYALFTGNGTAKFGVEGIEFGAQIDIEVIMENGQGVIGSDKVRMRVAPYALLDHTLPVNTAAGAGETVFIENRGVNNDELRNALRTEYGSTHVDEASSSDSWHQDGYEIGYAQAPYGHLPIVLSLPRGARGGNLLYIYTHNELLKENVGVCTRIEGPFSHTQECGGNLEVIPRDNGNRPGYFFHGDRMAQYMVDFFTAQDVNPEISVTTDWMGLGHVDEIFSPAPDGQRILAADPEVCWALLVWADNVDENALMLQGMPNPSGVTVKSVIENTTYWNYNFNTVMAPANLPYIRETKLGLSSPESDPAADASNSGTASLSSGGAFIGFFPNDQKRYYRVTFVSSSQYVVEYREEAGAWISDGSGLTIEDCVFENALCFFLHHWWSGTPDPGDIFTFEADPLCNTLEIPVIYDLVAVTNNSINCQVNQNTVFTAEVFGPHVDYLGIGTASDILEDYRDNMFAKVYSNIQTPDERFYHNLNGSIHCGTNVQRVIPSYNWWDF